MKPLTISSDTEMPPGGWKLTVPETGVTVHAGYANQLHGKVNAHRLANGLPVIGRAEFEDAACRESGHGAPWCTGVKNPKPPTTMHRVRSFLRAFVAVAKRREFVDDMEYQRRLAICAVCPLHSLDGLGCHGCIAELNTVEKETGPIPNGLVGVCTACGCLTAVKAKISNRVLDEAEAKEPVAYDPACWRLGH